MKKTSLIISIVIIALVALSAGIITNITMPQTTAEAEAVGVNGYVGNSSTYVPFSGDVPSGITPTAISSYSVFVTWMKDSATSASPKYGYLTTDITWESGDMLGATIQYHHLDCCGHTITINSTIGSNPSITPESSNISGAWPADGNFVEYKTSSDTSNPLHSNYTANKTPFGANAGNNYKGCYTWGYLGSIFANSELMNLNVKFSGNFVFNTTNMYRGQAMGILFGYTLNSKIDNCNVEFGYFDNNSVEHEAHISIHHGGRDGDTEGQSTACVGGFTGVLDGETASITNSRIYLSKNSYMAATTHGLRSGLINYGYGRSFVGGMVGSLVNAASIVNATAAGQGNIRAWCKHEYNQDSNKNTLAGAGIIAGINVSTGPAASAYTPANTGNTSNASKATNGTIDGVICSWAGVAAFYVGSSVYVFGDSQGDMWYHAKTLDGNKTKNGSFYFYGGLICAHSSGDNIRNIYYTFDKTQAYTVAWDSYRYLQSIDGNANESGQDKNCELNLDGDKTGAGVQPVANAGSYPAANYLETQIYDETQSKYVVTSGTWNEATYNTSDLLQVGNYETKLKYFTFDGVYEKDANGNIVTDQGNPVLKKFYINARQTSQGSLSNYYDTLTLEWSDNSSMAAVNAVINCKRISGYTADSGMIAWTMDVNGSITKLYKKATGVQDAIENYTVYAQKVVKRAAKNRQIVLKANTGYAVTYSLENSVLANGYNKVYDGQALSASDMPKAYIKTINSSTGELVQANISIADLTNKTSTYTQYLDNNIWAVYKAGDAARKNFEDIKNAGEYTVRIFNGYTSATNEKSRYDFINETNRIVAYRGDYAKYNKGYVEATGITEFAPGVTYYTYSTQNGYQVASSYVGGTTYYTLEPLSDTYRYTISQREVDGAWLNNVAPEDFEYSGALGRFGTGDSFAYAYKTEQAAGHGWASGETGLKIETLYYKVKYIKTNYTNLEMNEEYYYKDSNEEYQYVGICGAEGKDKYFYILTDVSEFVDGTEYYIFNSITNKFERVMAEFDENEKYYYKDGNDQWVEAKDIEIFAKGVTYYTAITEELYQDLDSEEPFDDEVEYYIKNGENDYTPAGTISEFDPSKTYAIKVVNILEYVKVVRPFDENQTYYTQLEISTNKEDEISTSTMFYRKGYVQVGSVTEAGLYRIYVAGVNSSNYKLSDTSLVTEYEIEVSPVKLGVEFRNVNNIVYNTNQQKVSWVLVNNPSSTNKLVGSEGSTVATANVVIYNAYEATAVVVTYPDPNRSEYTAAKDYYVDITLGTTGNYILPELDDIGTLITSKKTENNALVNSGEVLADLVSIEDKTLTRKITIKKADVVLLKQDTEVSTDLSDAVYFSDNKAWDLYSALGSTKNYKVQDGSNEVYEEAYYETTKYTGFNSLSCVYRGEVKEVAGKNYDDFDMVYTNIVYYRAAVDGDVYKFDSSEEGVNIITGQGYYVAVISFKDAVYTNYNKATEYIVFYVEGISLTLTVNASAFKADLPQGVDYIEKEYNNMDYGLPFVGELDSSITTEGVTTITYLTKTGEPYAAVSGELAAASLITKAGLTFKFYRLDNSYAGDDYVMIDEDKYAPSNEIRKAGTYIVVVSYEELSFDGYAIGVQNYTKCDALSTKYYSLPYFTVIVTPHAIELSVEAAEKTYSEEFVGNIAYTISDGEYLNGDGANLTIVFESEGFAAGAEVGTYFITATATGDAACNYQFTVKQTEENEKTFTVNKKTLVYTIANIEKEYGQALNLNSPVPSYSLPDGAVYGTDDVTPTNFASEGALAVTGVGSYAITAELTGAKAGNYDIQVVGNVVVTPITLTISGDITPASSLEYNAQEKTPVVVFDGVLAGDIEDVIAVFEYNDDTTVKPIYAGEYTARVIGISGAKAGNYVYEVEDKDVEFTITPRTVTVSIADVEIGYGDTHIEPNGKGYDLVETQDFVDSDIQDGSLIIAFLPREEEYMDGEPGFEQENAITIEISGAAAASYNFSITRYGTLSVASKDIADIKLVSNSTTYTGSDLISQIVLDTKSTGVGIVEFAKLPSGVSLVDAQDEDWSVVTAVVNAAIYRVRIEIVDNSSGYYVDLTPQEAHYLYFTVNKADLDAEAIRENYSLAIYYNKIVFMGNFEGEIMVSPDGVYDENYEITDTLSGCKEKKSYTFYVKIAESENYNESELVVLTNIKTTYDPQQYIDALAELGDNFGYKSVDTYLQILQNIDRNVSVYDMPIINNSSELTAAEARYNKLMSVGNKAIVTTKQIAGLASNKTYQIASTAALSSLGLLVAGLSCFFIKKKKANNVKEGK